MTREYKISAALKMVDVDETMVFDYEEDRVTVSRVTDEAHEDPAIASFLALLEKDIRAGQNLAPIPDNLMKILLTSLGGEVDLRVDIEGDVEL